MSIQMSQNSRQSTILVASQHQHSKHIKHTTVATYMEYTNPTENDIKVNLYDENIYSVHC